MAWYDILIPTLLRIVGAALVLLQSAIDKPLGRPAKIDEESEAIEHLQKALDCLKRARQKKPGPTPGVFADLDLDGDGLPDPR
jgi:hypothetical protein